MRKRLLRNAGLYLVAALTVVASSLISSNLLARPQTARAEFEVASLKLAKGEPPAGMITGAVRSLPGGRLSAPRATLRILIMNAYKLELIEQFAGGPDWIDTDQFDIEARASDSNATREQIRSMLQSFLEDRFKLKFHREMRQIPAYDLIVVKTGLKLKPPEGGPCPDSNQPMFRSDQPFVTPCGSIFARGGKPTRMDGRNISMADLGPMLFGAVHRPVVDKTGFTGKFDIHLAFTPSMLADADSTDATIFTALEQQLGVKLESSKTTIDVLVVDHAERPEEHQ